MGRMPSQLRARVQELEAQVGDLMVYLDTQQRVEKSPLKEEIRAGAMLVADGGQAGRRRGRSRRK